MCLSECPNTEFFFKQKGMDFKKVFCVDNIKPRSNIEASDLITKGECGFYYFPSQPSKYYVFYRKCFCSCFFFFLVGNKCIPTNINYTDILQELKNKNISYNDLDEAIKKLKSYVLQDVVCFSFQ